MGHSHHHHGSIFAGRIMTAAGGLLILVANGLIFKIAATPPHPIPGVEVMSVISIVWMLTGVCGLIMHKSWGRYFAMTVLYAGSLGWFIAIVITLTDGTDSALQGHLKPLYFATPIYIYVALVFTYSKHIHRLTSRAWE